MMKEKLILSALVVGLVWGTLLVTSATAAQVDLVNGSTRTISASQLPAMGTTACIVAPGGSSMFAANVGARIYIAKDPHPAPNTIPSGLLKYFSVSSPSKTYRVVVSGRAESAADVTIEEFSGSEY